MCFHRGVYVAIRAVRATLLGMLEIQELPEEEAAMNTCIAQISLVLELNMHNIHYELIVLYLILTVGLIDDMAKLMWVMMTLRLLVFV